MMRSIVLWVGLLGLVFGAVPRANAVAEPGGRPAAAPYLGLPAEGPRTGSWRPEVAFPRQPKFSYPVGFVPYPGNRLLVYTQPGLLILIPNDPASDQQTVMLDLVSHTLGYGDTGLLSVALHPEFGREGSPNRGYLYVWYAHYEGEWPTGWEYTTWNRLSRFTVPDGSDVIDPASELVLIEQADRHLWHAGGALMFHPEDGFLYVTVSDEGGENGVYGNAQKVTDGFFSGVLRIDVDRRGGDVSHPIRHQPVWGRTTGYYIPNDNPWSGEDGVLEEFYAIGLRNPHRMSHDPGSGMVFIGDVGQVDGEEVNVLRKGANYGWPFRNVVFDGPQERPAEIRGTLTEPFFHYPRSWGFCVIGGFVYRGGKYSELLEGKYVFADLGGAVWAADFDAHRITDIVQISWIPNPWETASLGRDAEGEIYLTGNREGVLWRLVVDPAEDPGLPALLSETGLFSDTPALAPSPALVPYEVNSPLWSDGAAKRRWFSVPFDPATPEAGPFVGFRATGGWDFPAGSVFVKHFEIATNELDPAAVRRLETRILVRTDDDRVYGMTYRWRPDHSDADLVLTRSTEELEIRTADGVRRQEWLYPGTFDCLVCHTPQSGWVLGVNTRQLNRAAAGDDAGDDGNQLAALIRAGFFHEPPASGSVGSLPRLPDPAGSEGSLHDRVRSYLDANCAHCHLPGGVRAAFDARFDTPLALQNLIGGPANDDLGRPGTRIVAPGSTGLSSLHQRVTRNDHVRMPPLARSETDPVAARLLSEWIRQMPRAALVTPAKTRALPADPLRLQVGVDPGTTGIERIEYRIDGRTAAVVRQPPYAASVAEVSWGYHDLTAVVYGPDGIAYPSSTERLWLHPSDLRVRFGSGGTDTRRVDVFGPPGLGVELERSTDLRAWLPVVAGELDPSFSGVVEGDASPGSFYRARVVPAAGP